MENKFKVGDKVKFIRDYPANINSIKLGQLPSNAFDIIYTVNGINPRQSQISPHVSLFEISNEIWFETRFELVNYTTTTTLLKRYIPVSTHREDCKCPFINLGLVHKPSCSFYRLGEY